jgi:hypothetical protein
MRDASAGTAGPRKSVGYRWRRAGSTVPCKVEAVAPGGGSVLSGDAAVPAGGGDNEPCNGGLVSWGLGSKGTQSRGAR